MRHVISLVPAPIPRPLKHVTRQPVHSGDTLSHDGMRVHALEEQIASSQPVQVHRRDENVVEVVSEALLVPASEARVSEG